MLDTKYWHLFSLMRNERRTLDYLLDMQMFKLKRLLAHAYHNVPFYREKFRQAGLLPGDVKTMEDFQRLPIISKADFHQQTCMDYIDRRIEQKALTSIKTSGSSGETLEFFVDRAYDQFRKAQFLRPYLTNGQRITDRILSFTGRPRLHKRFMEYALLLREKQISSHLDPQIHLEILRKFRPEVVRGYPSVLALIGAQIHGETQLLYPPRRIFTDSELLTPAMRRTIETAFNRKVVDIYGTMETDNIGYECEQHCGYHIAIDCVIMEFVENGKTVEPGAPGEIVCTVLENFAMPFIRYRLNDFGICAAKACSCGRAFPLMTGLQGRTHSYALTREGERVSSTTLLAEMDHFADYIKAFQIFQEDYNLFTLNLVPGKKYGRSVAEKILARFNNLFPGAVIRIALSERLCKEGSGKVMPFKSLVAGSRVESTTTL
jgi:phenylacetate-CoA ligase